MSQEPLVPPEVELRDFAFMPLDCVRLRDSDLAGKCSGDEFRAAVLLWCASWHQEPAASLPDDDEILAKLSGYGRVVKEWLKVKAGALRGWVACSDGRLYHPVVAEKALDAWRGKLIQRWKTECARIRKHAQRHKMELALPEFDAWVSQGCPMGHALPVPEDKAGTSRGQTCETPSKGQGERQGQGQGQGFKYNTDANASGGKPPDLQDSVFALGVPMLTAAGVSDRNSRSMLAMLCKQNGAAKVVDALQRCATEKPIQPVPWLQAALKPRGAGKQDLSRVNYREGVTEDGAV